MLDRNLFDEAARVLAMPIPRGRNSQQQLGWFR